MTTAGLTAAVAPTRAKLAYNAWNLFGLPLFFVPLLAASHVVLFLRINAR